MVAGDFSFAGYNGDSGRGNRIFDGRRCHSGLFATTLNVTGDMVVAAIVSRNQQGQSGSALQSVVL